MCMELPDRVIIIYSVSAYITCFTDLYNYECLYITHDSVKSTFNTGQVFDDLERFLPLMHYGVYSG